MEIGPRPSTRVRVKVQETKKSKKGDSSLGRGTLFGRSFQVVLVSRNQKERARMAMVRAKKILSEEENHLSSATIVVGHIFYMIVKSGKRHCKRFTPPQETRCLALLAHTIKRLRWNL